MRTLVYFMIRRIFEIVIFGIFRVKVKGRENIPAEGAVIVAPNHRSNWDPPLVGVAFNTRLVHYMAKEELFRNPVVSAVFTFLGSFPVKRNSADRAALRQALKLLKGGELLGIFPEGTRIHGTALGKFHPGMSSLALMTGTPILPVAVIGTECLPRKKGPIVIAIGEPIPVKRSRATDELVEEIDRKVRASIIEMTDAYGEKR